MLIRIVRKTIVLGLAGLGIYKAWEIGSANLGTVREKANRAKQRIEPAVHQAEADVMDASRIAVASVAEAVSDAALGGSEATSRTG